VLGCNSPILTVAKNMNESTELNCCHYHVNKQSSSLFQAKDSPPSKKKSTFDFARLGPRHKNPNNCSLELKKVPRGLNNITHLNNHFSKFGKIVNIQVRTVTDVSDMMLTMP
jgi:RNA-binding protein 26